MKSLSTRALGLTLGMSLVLAGAMTRIAQATDIGLDPSHLRLVYTVDGGPVPGEPVYKVEVPGAAGSNFNTSSTPFLLPCNVNRFGVDVVADSDLRRNYPVRMQLKPHAYADSGFTTLIPDTDSSNDVFNFWVMRANTGNCSH